MKDEEIASAKTELQVPSQNTQTRDSNDTIRTYAREFLWRFERVKQAFINVLRESKELTPALQKMQEQIDFADRVGCSLTHSLARTHVLKADPAPFYDVSTGKKQFEVRVFDRDFREGDYLQLCEFDRATRTYSGSQLLVRITYILAPGLYGLAENVGVMGIELVV